MLLRNSFSNTKKFFRKTVQSFKSLFSGGYQKLPKTTPPHPLSYAASVNLTVQYSSYEEFAEPCDSGKDQERKGSKKKAVSSPTKQETEVYRGSFIDFSQATPVKKNHTESREEYHHNRDDTRSIPHQRKRQEDYCSEGLIKEGRTCLVAQKLKELEMLDMSNVDHLLDIEDVLHYYSRINCPAYLDIVDRFFMDIYEEFFGAASLTPASLVSSRLRPRSVKP